MIKTENQNIFKASFYKKSRQHLFIVYSLKQNKLEEPGSLCESIPLYQNVYMDLHQTHINEVEAVPL